MQIFCKILASATKGLFVTFTSNFRNESENRRRKIVSISLTLGIIVLIGCFFAYVAAQISATGIIASRFLGLDYEIAVYVALVGILLCSMLGGMRAVTWTQVAQYIVLIIAYLVPVFSDLPLSSAGKVIPDI